MTNANTSEALPVNRTFKSTLFIMLFEDKKNLLELYNAITGKHYADPGDRFGRIVRRFSQPTVYWLAIDTGGDL